MPQIPPNDDADRDWPASLRRGLFGRCPNCGEGGLFSAYLKLRSACPACGETFSAYRADDAPAYFVIFIVGHIVVPLVLLVEKLYEPDLWVHAVLWLPLGLGLCLWLLPRVKGATLGVLWALKIRSPQPG